MVRCFGRNEFLQSGKSCFASLLFPPTVTLIPNHDTKRAIHSEKQLEQSNLVPSPSHYTAFRLTGYMLLFLLILQFFLWILAAGFLEALHSYLYFFLILDFLYLCSLSVRRCWLLWRRWWRCRWRSKNHKWYIVGYIAINLLVIFDEMWFLTAGPVVSIHMILAELPERKNCGVFSRSITLTNKSNRSTYTAAPSPVCTSQLAVITVVRLLDILMVSNSAELRSLLLTMCIL